MPGYRSKFELWSLYLIFPPSFHLEMGAFLLQGPGQVKFIESAIFRNIQYLGPRKGWKELRKKGVRKEENVRQCSVADLGCLSRNPDPDMCPPRSPDPTPAKKKEGKIFCSPFFSHKYHKIENDFIFDQVKTKICANSLRIIVLFTQKLSLSSDPGSGSAPLGNDLRTWRSRVICCLNTQFQIKNLISVSACKEVLGPKMQTACSKGK